MTNVDVQTDLIYDKTQQLALDLYQPNDQTPTFAIIDIHGGGWFRGDKGKDADWATSLAELGYLVVVPNYRITPTAFYPAPLADMDQVVSWLQNASVSFDLHHIGIVGSSAGGNMAVELGIKYGFPIVSLSGILDIEDWLADHRSVVAQQDQKQDFTHSASATINQTGRDDPFYKWFVTNYFNGETDQYHTATPYYHVTDQTGPMFLANSLDEFVPNSGVLSMVQSLNAHNIPSTTRFISGTKHAKGYLPEVADDVVSFLEQNLN